MTAVKEPEFFSLQVLESRRFFLDLLPQPSQTLLVICGGREHCAPHYQVRRNDFPYLSMEFVASGKGALTLAGREHPLMPGAVFSYGPGIPHEFRSDSSEPLVKYFVDFTGGDKSQLVPPPAPQPGQIVQTAAPEHVLRLFEDLIDSGRNPSPFQRPICTAIVQQLLLRVAESALPIGALGAESFQTYLTCRQYIECHYRRIQSLTQVAQTCGVDPSYLCRVFKRYDHQSPWQLVTRLKMRDAAQHLQAPGILVKNVAGMLGFRDAFEFSRTFRRVYRISPKRFIQMQQAATTHTPEETFPPAN